MRVWGKGCSVVTHREFQRRCKVLGCPNFHAAAHRLQLPPSSVYRNWTGQRKVSERTEQRLLDVEREQPEKPLTPLMARLLLTWPDVPVARSNYEAGIDWLAVADDLADAGLVEPLKRTPLGARTVAWLRERDG